MAVDSDSSAVLRSEDDTFRSHYVRRLVQGALDQRPHDRRAPARAPRTVIQFWDDPANVPDDVAMCMGSWQSLQHAGFSVRQFDDTSARRFVSDNLEPRHVSAFERCYHPAMRSDYFRLCYVGLLGGYYVDADDRYSGRPLAGLRSAGRLTLQPLCYDVRSDTMVPPDVFTRQGAGSDTWIFYFNNNPLIAPPRHPVVIRALERSTALLNSGTSESQLEIQSTTGPGNLTASLVAEWLLREGTGAELALTVAAHWEQLATSVWPLSYRADTRNWRLANRRPFVR